MTREDRRDALFIAASELPAAERAAYLEAECGGDTELLDDLRSLMAADTGAVHFLEGVVAEAAHAVMDDAAGECVGRRVGPWVIESLLGHGGMGAVYVARRADEQFERRVAIKVMRLGADGPAARRRFVTERQILANLEHPFIARMLDGGTTGDGTPYVVMDYVDGDPIDAWADDRALNIEARLRLFVNICDVVQYAHSNLVVHRDIKPSNILITADGTPRLIDFGIAKLLDGAWTAAVTRTGSRMLTPEYASPEQLRGQPVTVATDVYSLGVLLYELLTGRWPYEHVGGDAHTREHAVLETPPLAPSAAVGSRDTRSCALAAARGTDPRRLRRRLQGDVDTIVLTALRKQPTRRYGSVADLGEDVRRHLKRLPLNARRDTFWYRATRFAQRHWVGLSAAALAVLALGAGSVLAWTGLLEARTAQEQAEVSATRARSISSFLSDMLSSVRPNRARGRVVTVREVLDSAAARLTRGGSSSDDPEVQAALLFTIGQSYLSLGELNAAAPVLQRARAIQTELYGELDERTIFTEIRLGEVYWERGDLEAAQISAEQVLAARRETVGTSTVGYSNALMNVAITWIELGRYDLAEPRLRESVAIAREVMQGDDLPLLSYQLNWLATVLGYTGQYAEAINLHEESLALRRRFWSETSPTDIVTGLTMFAETLDRAGRLNAAEAAAREAIGRAEGLLGPDHPVRANAEVALARALQLQGRFSEAEPLLRQALDSYATELDPLGWRPALTRGYLGEVLLSLDRPDAAERELARAWTLLAAALSPDHPEVLAFAREVSSLFDEVGEQAEAEAWLRRAD